MKHTERVWKTVGEPTIDKPVEIPVPPVFDGMIHVFERAGLGPAPYTFLGVQVHPTGCQYCGTAISYMFWLRAANGKKFYVGSDCIFKSGDAGMRRIVEPIVKEHEKKLREEREKDYILRFTNYLQAHPDYWQAANPGPHPYSWHARNGKTMGDYKKFIYEHAGRTKRATVARQALIGLGLETPRRKPKAV
jgi:hypothetical protein